MIRSTLALLIPLVFLCCQRKDDGGAASTAASAEERPKTIESKGRSVVPEAELQAITNPSAREPYAGPTGTVAGVVRVTGDKAPPLELGEAEIPRGKCFEAHQTYASLFREGPGRALADVLVAVTEYDGYLPPPKASPLVIAKGCAFDTRTVALMLGQSLHVKNEGAEAVTPQLLGARAQALLIALPGGEPIELYPQKIGLHKLIDRSHEFAFADVYVVPYRTHDVTGLDGRFEIGGVPVGEVKLSALLPATGKTTERTIEVRASETTNIVLEIAFDAEAAKAAPPAPQPAKSGGPGPAASGQ